MLFFVVQQSLGPDWFCLTLYFFTATFGSLNYLIWNYWSKVTLELTNNCLKIQPVVFSIQPRIQSYQKHEVKNLRIIQAHERVAAFESVWFEINNFEKSGNHWI
jgi:hypothetical protein